MEDSCWIIPVPANGRGRKKQAVTVFRDATARSRIPKEIENSGSSVSWRSLSGRQGVGKAVRVGDILF